MQHPVRLPFYVKASLLLVAGYVLISMLSIAQDLLIPLIFAFIIASVLSPAVHFLTQKKLNRPLSIALAMAAALLLVAGLIAFISGQASLLSEAWPQLTVKFQEFLDQAIAWVSKYFNVSVGKINAWITKATNDVLNNSGAAIGLTLTTMGEMLAIVFLTPVYIFMILYYQPHLVQFIHKLFGSDHNDKVTEILNETKVIIQSYLYGLFAETAIVAVMNAAGLLILGIDYAILLGIIGALLNIIPYIGGIIAMGLFMIVALVTKSPAAALHVLMLYTVIQFVDNNLIVPKIVGSRVRLNALVSLVGVIAGAALWGIPGMFLAIPLIAIVKLLFDRIETMKPWGFLMGDMKSPLELKLDFSNFPQNLLQRKPPFRPPSQGDETV